MTNFSQKLKDTMKSLGLSQTRLSDMTGIPKSCICQYISGRNIPGDDRREEIAIALGLPHDYFASPETVRKSYVLPGKVIPRLTVEEAASMMGLSKPVLVHGLRDGIFPWGYALRGNGEKYVYFINAKRFAEIEGIEEDEEQ